MSNEELPTAQRVETNVPVQATVVSATPLSNSSPPENYLIIWSLSRTVKVFSFLDIFFAFLNALYYNSYYFYREKLYHLFQKLIDIELLLDHIPFFLNVFLQRYIYQSLLINISKKVFKFILRP